jgi:murein DD-endopeptidase MepM/ murein hydrolase activator NlpD
VCFVATRRISAVALAALLLVRPAAASPTTAIDAERLQAIPADGPSLRRVGALQPGEVVRLELESPEPLAEVRARAFGRTVPFHRRDDARWWALVGLDVALPPGDHVVEVTAFTRSGGVRSIRDVLAIEPKEFPTRNLRVAPRFVSPPPSAGARIRKEGQRVAAVYRAESAEVFWSGAFVMPVKTGVVSGFGLRSVFNGKAREPHSGLDLAGPAGTPVLAPNAGRVVLAGALYFTGNTVIVDHGAGLYSILAHLSRIQVREGDLLAREELVGEVGATGRVTGPHLHWGVRLNGARVDPRALIGATSGQMP